MAAIQPRELHMESMKKRRASVTRWLAAAVTIAGLGALVAVGVPEAVAQVRAALIRDVDSPVRGVRFTENVQLLFSAGQFSVTQVITPTIPAGKKLFLQSVNTHTLLTDGQSLMDARLSVLGPGLIARFSVDQDFQAAGTTQRHFTGHQAINMVVEPGETIQVFLFRNDNLGASSLNFSNVSLLGYLVDANM
jgi:hypothetical protein